MNEKDAALAAAWLLWLASGNLSPATIRNRRYTLGTFARCYPLETATAEDIGEHLRGLRSAASKSGHLAALRSFYKWAHLSGRLDHDPTVLVRDIRVNPGVPKPVPKAILDRGLLLADPETRFMLLLGSRAGLRRAEIAALSSLDVGVTHLTILGKGSKLRRVPIHPALRPYLDELVAHPGWAFPSHVAPGQHITPETVQRRVTRALGEPWTTHSLRHYFAGAAYRACLDIRAVQELLGHSSPTITARYCEADQDTITAAVLAVA